MLEQQIGLHYEKLAVQLFFWLYVKDTTKAAIIVRPCGIWTQKVESGKVEMT